MKILTLIVSLLLSNLQIKISNARYPESKITANYENWNMVFTRDVSSSIISFPVKTSKINKIFQRYDPYVTLIKYGNFIEFSLSTGFEHKLNEHVTLEFYKTNQKKYTSSYKLYTLNIYAYPYDKDNLAIIDSIKNNDYMLVYSLSPDESEVIDEYRFNGFNSALRELLKK